MMRAFLDSFSSIPKELWTPLGTLAAGIFTAFVAFTAVVLQNMAAGRRHRRELEHDASQRELERASELRKIVYLDALDNFAQSSAIMSDIWNMAVSGEEIAKSLRKQIKKASSRLYAIANLATIRALDEVNRAAIDMVESVVSVRFAHENEKQSEKKISEFFERAVKKRNEVAAAIAESKELDQDKKKALEEEYARLQSFVSKSADKLLDSNLHRLNAQVDIQMVGIERKAKFDRAMWKLILAIRQELGFKIDENAFSELMDNFSKYSADTLRSVVKETKEYMEKADTKLREEKRDQIDRLT